MLWLWVPVHAVRMQGTRACVRNGMVPHGLALLGAEMTISTYHALWPRACGFGGKHWVSPMLPLTYFRTSPRLNFLIPRVRLLYKVITTLLWSLNVILFIKQQSSNMHTLTAQYTEATLHLNFRSDPRGRMMEYPHLIFFFCMQWNKYFGGFKFWESIPKISK